VVGLDTAVAYRSKTCRAAGDEGSCGVGVAAGRHENVDDLTVLLDRPVDSPAAGNLDVGFVDKPAITRRVPTWPGRVDELWGLTGYCTMPYGYLTDRPLRRTSGPSTR
jgi:hypothetical protein